MIPNPVILFGCAFIPMVVSLIWYHPKVFGKTYQNDGGITDGKSDKWYHYVLSYACFFFLAFGIYELTVHQAHVYGLTGANPDVMTTGTTAAFMAEFGQNYLTPVHGVVHAIIGILAFVIPFTAVQAIRDKKSIKYFLVNAGYWAVTFFLMGIIIAQWGGVPVS